MATTYTNAPEVRDIALELIREVDPHSALINVEVRYIWRIGDPAKSKGQLVYGKARKISGLNAYLADANDPDLGFFVIEMSAKLWEFLEPHQQRALVDHELSHCQVAFDDDDVMTLSIRGHDVEEFHGVVRRHGAWRPEIATLRELAGQQRLDVPIADKGTLARELSAAEMSVDGDLTPEQAGALQKGNLALVNGDLDGARRAIADFVNASGHGFSIDKDRV